MTLLRRVTYSDSDKVKTRTVRPEILNNPKLCRCASIKTTTEPLTNALSSLVLFLPNNPFKAEVLYDIS
jgi:hypothetical protein